MTQISIPAVPWQMTGNHWLAVPNIHPDNASIHLVGLVHRGARGAVEFAGSPDFLSGKGEPLVGYQLRVNGTTVRFAESGMVWERLAEWVPVFSTLAGTVKVRGTVFAPHSLDAGVPGLVYLVTLENKSSETVAIHSEFAGRLGHRQLRVQTARTFADAHQATRTADNVLLLEGSALPGLACLAVAGGEQSVLNFSAADSGSFRYDLSDTFELEPGQKRSVVLYLAAGAERDGAAATINVLMNRGYESLLDTTVRSLQGMLQADTGSGVERLIDRNLMMAYFYSVARAIDDAQFYMVRSRAPWHPRGMTIRDWEALTWIVPAVLLADPPLARELILRACELHGYAPGHGLRYLDGAIFEPGFSLEGASSYALVVERYIRETGDDQIVEEPILADTLYVSHEEIQRRREPRFPLYSTEVHPDGGFTQLPLTLHGNAVVAQALDIFGRTLDEESARKVESAAAVRAAMRRHFVGRDGDTEQLAAAIDGIGGHWFPDFASASKLWLPIFEAMDRDETLYRRTARAIVPTDQLVQWCGRLVGPDAVEAAAALRRAPLFEGVAATTVDADGRATSGAGDAALAGLLASSLWHAAHVLGVRL